MLLALLFMAGLKALESGRLLWLLLVAAAGVFVVMKSRPRTAALLTALLVSAGLVRAHLQFAREVRVEQFVNKAAVITGMVAREPFTGRGGVSFPLEVKSVLCETKTASVEGSVWVFAPQNTRLAYLDLVEITGELRPSKRGRGKTGAYISVGDARLLRKIGKGRENLAAAAGKRVRSRVTQALERVLPTGYRGLNAQLLGTLFFGTHGAGLPGALVEMFRRTGTIHVLVVSGTQISLLFMLVYLPGLTLQWRRRQAIGRQLRLAGIRGEDSWAAISLPGMVRPMPSAPIILTGLTVMSIYALLTQGGEPVARAALMGGLIGGSHFLRHFPRLADRHGLDLDRYTLLAAAAIGILVFNPKSLSDIGFQLSFAAVTGLAFLAPKFRALLHTLSDFWAYLLAAPVAAQLATLPVIAWHFGQVPAIGLISNMVVVPIAALLLWLGLAAFGLAMIAWPLAWPLGWISGQLCWLMSRTVAFFAHLPVGVFFVGKPSWMALATYVIGLILLGAGLSLWPPRRDNDLEALERSA